MATSVLLIDMAFHIHSAEINAPLSAGLQMKWHPRPRYPIQYIRYIYTMCMDLAWDELGLGPG